MTLNDFVIRWNGKYIDTDNSYGFQCMDLLHQYVLEVLGLFDLSILAAPSAKDVYNNFETIKGHEYFERIPNTPTNIPDEGDIIFWGYGEWGHVAVFIEGDVDSLKSFDQNYPTGSPCHIQGHTYANCLGWLRFKKTSIVSPELSECQTQLADEIKKKNENYQSLQEVSSELEGTKSQIHSYEDYVKQLATTLKVEPEQTKILGECVKLIKVEDQLRNEQKKTENLTQELQEVTKTANESSLKIQDLLGASDELTKAKQVCESALEIATTNNNVTYKELFTIFGLVVCTKTLTSKQ